jgi:hypothetical protein
MEELMVSDATLGSVLSVDDMLARSREAVKSGKTTANMSAVEKLLAGRDEPEDTVDLSPVQKLLARQQQDQEKESYFESDDFYRLKVQQLQGQLALYATLPGLDPDGSNIAQIQGQIQAIIDVQQQKFAEIEAKRLEAQTAQEEKERLAALEGPSPEDLLAKLRGELPEEELSRDVKNLLRNVGASIDIST